MRNFNAQSFFLFSLAGALALSCSSGQKSSSPTMAPITASGCAGGSPVPDSCCTGGRQVSFTGDCSLTGSSVQPVKAALANGATTAGNAQKALETANKMVDPTGANSNGTTLAATAGSLKSGTAGTPTRVENPSAPALGTAAAGGTASGNGSTGSGAAGGGGGGGNGLSDVKTAAASGETPPPTQMLGDAGSMGNSAGGGGGGGAGGARNHHDSGMPDLFGSMGGAGAGGAAGGSASTGLQYGAVAGANEKPLAIQDPEDYFSRLTAQDNIFTVVERRYQKTTLGWAANETQQILRRAQK